MKRLALALALMCVLSTSIFAGDMPTGGRSEQPPPQVAGNMPTGGRSEQPPPGSSTSTLLASVILAVLSLR